jgi:hypothetical protein
MYKSRNKTQRKEEKVKKLREKSLYKFFFLLLVFWGGNSCVSVTRNEPGNSYTGIDFQEA